MTTSYGCVTILREGKNIGQACLSDKPNRKNRLSACLKSGNRNKISFAAASKAFSKNLPVLRQNGEVMYEKIVDTIIEVISNELDIDPADLNAETSLTNDLKVDSLDFVEISLALEDIYGVSFDDDELAKSMSASTTIGDIAEYLISLGVSE